MTHGAPDYLDQLTLITPWSYTYVENRLCFLYRWVFLNISTYNIPEPPPTEHDKEQIERGSLIVREDLKRFRKEYSQPVALR